MFGFLSFDFRNLFCLWLIDFGGLLSSSSS
jgi:hypothetical protein